MRKMTAESKRDRALVAYEVNKKEYLDLFEMLSIMKLGANKKMYSTLDVEINTSTCPLRTRETKD